MKKLTKVCLSASIFAAALSACCTKTESTTTLSGLDPAKFNAEVRGKQTALYTLTNAQGMEVCVTNFGGRIVSVMVPDKDGNMKDWWTEADAKNFVARTDKYADFFSNINVLPDLKGNGRLTLGENLADHGGLQVSYNAFLNATKGQKLKTSTLCFLS